MGSWVEKPEFWHSAYLQHGFAILSYLQVRTSNHAQAEDLLQETFLRAIKSAHALKDITKIRSFLFAIAHNLLVDTYKQKKLTTDVSTDLPDPGPSPEETFSGQAFKNQLEFMMKTLSNNHRKAFELAILGGLSYHEISKETGWSIATVKINVYRARKQIISGMKSFI